MKPERKTVKEFLEDWVDDMLGEHPCIEIRDYMADQVEEKTKDLCYVFIQRYHHDGHPLKTPVLWRYNFWKDSSDNYIRAKRESDERVRAKFVYDENVKRLMRKLVDYAMLPPDIATSAAHRVMRKSAKQLANTAKELGVKIVEKFEEL